MAAARQPANQPIVLDDGRTMPAAWVAFFDDVSKRLADSELRHTAHEARLLNLEQFGSLLVAAGSYANDAAAAAAGVPIGGYYRSGSQVLVRVV
jgi:hypothetical protein